MTYMTAEPIEPEPHVRRVGVRELQKNTAAVIRQLTEAGETAEITNRGEVVARLTPVSPDEALIRAMVAQGEMTPAERPGGLLHRNPLPPRSDGRSAADALSALREEERW
jgi:antitoxin (DNA-binding transcriptional repressor) of toxin-antitoxin stability system